MLLQPRKLPNNQPQDALTEANCQIRDLAMQNTSPRGLLQRMFPNKIEQAAMLGQARMIEEQFTLYSAGVRLLNEAQIERMRETQYQLLTKERIAGRIAITEELQQKQVGLAESLSKISQQYIRRFNQRLEEIESIRDAVARERAEQQIREEFIHFLDMQKTMIEASQRMIADVLDS